ncbi:hypothetical protein ASE74_15980 [Pedobacter sp. Leaf216]|uniref:DUF4238 domain-containing protein n=1 Tax=Pedobacter sp. Leaf216 TaxID=1735684 RepID=UPI0007017B2B|nr:DUF4238 domain-containing protein [Pedobacter sp. Leaf216]KQM77898.1 hypothetical protein ASE74_15980 [Pedobacter sp. Leaf216]
MNNPVYQHYIPRSYLKNFGISKKKVFIVDTIMRGEDEEIKELPTQAICAEKNIYTFDTTKEGDPYALEKFYAKEVDSIYPKVYDRLVNSEVMHITPDVKREILNTVLSLKFRRPEALQSTIRDLEAMFARFYAHPSPEDSTITYSFRGKKGSFLSGDIEKELEKLRRELKEDWLIKHFGQWQEFVEYKMACGLDVIEVPEDIPIITSDNPVSIFGLTRKLNTENPFHPENMLEVPLDRRHYLVIHPNATSDTGYHRIHRSKRDKYFAAGVNHKTAENSDRRLIAYPGDLKTHFTSQDEINLGKPEDVRAFMDNFKDLEQALELQKIIAENGGSIFNQQVADKVREMRKAKVMDEDPLFKDIILELAKKGFLTI